MFGYYLCVIGYMTWLFLIGYTEVYIAFLDVCAWFSQISIEVHASSFIIFPVAMVVPGYIVSYLQLQAWLV